MRLLRRNTRRKSTPIGVPSIETREERGKRSGKVRLRRLSLGSLWFLAGLVNPKRLKPNLGFRVSWWTVGVMSTENLIHQSLTVQKVGLPFIGKERQPEIKQKRKVVVI